MRPIKNSADLKAAIAELEKEKPVKEMQIKENVASLKGNMQQAKEDFKIQNLVKNTYSRLAETPEINRTLMNTVVGFALGYAAKKAADLMHEGTMDNLIQNMVNYSVTKIENQNPGSKFSKALGYVRNFIDPGHPLHPFIGYRDKTIKI